MGQHVTIFCPLMRFHVVLVQKRWFQVTNAIHVKVETKEKKLRSVCVCVNMEEFQTVGS
jgi:hypothetical protein